jgi:hypothetical protein
MLAKKGLFPGRAPPPDGQAPGGGAMLIEITVPEDWSPELALAIRSLFQQAVSGGYPLVTWARGDARPEEVKEVFARIQAMIEASGLAA